MSKKEKRPSLKTPVGRLCFPAIFNKEQQMEGATTPPKYAATIVFDKAYLKANRDEMARFNAIREAADAVCREKFKKPLKDAAQAIPRFWNPFRDGKEKAHLDGYGDGTFFFKASSRNRPGAVGSDARTPIDDEAALYAGCYVRLSVSPYAFDNKMKGVGIGLNNVMFVKDGPPLAGGVDAAEDFGEFESNSDIDDTSDFDDPL
jgi:hypothetical protein